MDKVTEHIQRQGMVPVVRTESPAAASGVAKALAKEGLTALEFPWRGDATAGVVQAVLRQCPDTLAGAWGLVRPSQAEEAAAAGVKFAAVGVGNREVLVRCVQMGLTVYPVATCFSEVEAALREGFEHVQLSPIHLLGGPDALYQLGRMYPGVRFMPSGGIGTDTVEDYLSFGNVFACAGSWLAPPALLAATDWTALEQNAQDAMNAMLGLQLESVDAVASQEEQDKPGILGGFLGFVQDDFPAGRQVRLTISTYHIKRAVAYLTMKGYVLDMGTAPVNDAGRYPYVYFRDDVAGLAVRLLQKNSRPV